MTNEDISIRKYKNEDWLSILDIFNRAKPDEVRGSVEADDIVPLNEDSGLMESFQNSNIIVAEQNNKIIGFAGFHKYLISFLFTDPHNYRMGIGTLLIENILPNIKENAWLLVAKTNLPAINLYKKYGFKIAEEFTGKYNGKIEVRVLRLAINPSLESWKQK